MYKTYFKKSVSKNNAIETTFRYFSLNSSATNTPSLVKPNDS